MAIITLNNNSLSSVTSLPAAIETGSMVKLQTQTVTGSTVANVTFTSSVMTSDYLTFFLTGWLILDTNSQLHAYCYPSIDNGSNYNLDVSGSGEGRYRNISNTNSGVHIDGGFPQASGDNRWCLASDGMYGDQSAMQGSLMFSGYIVNSPDYTKVRSSTYYGIGNRMYAAGTSNYHTMGQYVGATSFESGSAINNIKIQASSGNIEIGSKFTLYGVTQ